MARLAAALAGLLLLAAGATLLDAYRVLNQPLQIEGDEYVIVVAAGATLAGTARRLAADGVIRNPQRLVRYARIAGDDVRIRAGEYALLPGMDARAMMRHLASGRTVQHAFTIVEGWTFHQLRRAVEAHPVLVQTLTGVSDGRVMERLERPGVHPEGMFYPDTYLFPRGTTDLQFLGRALGAMETRLERAWAGRDGGLPYATPYEALIMASIIEKEAHLAEERGTIAGVFVRRLQRGMRLQTDPTVIYGLGPEFEGRLRTRHLRTDTPYNTYTRHGLPPTPIALPGAGAIAAAMHPEPGDAMFFVARGDGSHHFSATLEEHVRAVARYQLGRHDD